MQVQAEMFTLQQPGVRIFQPQFEWGLYYNKIEETSHGIN